MESLLPIDDRTRVMQTWSITRNGSVDLVENNVELGEGTRSTRNESKPRMSTLVASWSLPFMQLRQLISPVQWCSWRHRGVSCGLRNRKFVLCSAADWLESYHSTLFKM